MLCFSKIEGTKLNETSCDLLYPLDYEKGYWNLNNTAYINEKEYRDKILNRTYVSESD